MERAEIQQQVRTYIVASFLGDGDAATLADDDDLLLILDSLQILRLIVAMEAQFSIKIDDSEMTAENLRSVSAIAALIAGKA